MGRSNNHPDRWPKRDCPYCERPFYKAPTYNTCGHPICIRKNRNTRDSKRKYDNKHRLAQWDPPDIYAPDKKSREKVWAYLESVSTTTLPPGLIESVAVQAKLKPVEVLEIWKSVKKEKESAGRS